MLGAQIGWGQPENSEGLEINWCQQSLRPDDIQGSDYPNLHRNLAPDHPVNRAGTGHQPLPYEGQALPAQHSCRTRFAADPPAPGTPWWPLSCAKLNQPSQPLELFSCSISEVHTPYTILPSPVTRKLITVRYPFRILHITNRPEQK